MQTRTVSEYFEEIDDIWNYNLSRARKLLDEVMLRKSEFKNDHHNKAADFLRRAGLREFNDKNYEKSALYLIASCEQINALELNDKLLRQLVKNYIDLADAFMHQTPPNQQGAMDAYKNAVEAFMYIKDKSYDEKALGNPYENFDAFHLFFEKQTSKPIYLTSTSFKNNERLIKAKLEDDSFSKDLDSLTVEKKKPQEPVDKDSLEYLLQHASINRESPFTQLPLSATTKSNDEDYRSMILNLVNYGINFTTQGSFPDAMKTFERATNLFNYLNEKDDDICRFLGMKLAEAAGLFFQTNRKDDSLKMVKQAVEILTKIQEKSPTDNHTLLNLQQHIISLTQPPQPIVQQTNDTVRQSTLGAFGPNGPLRAPSPPPAESIQYEDDRSYQNDPYRMDF